MTEIFRRALLPAFACVLMATTGCVSKAGKPPPSISLEDHPPALTSDFQPEAATDAAPDSPLPTIVEIPRLLPLPGQLQPATPIEGTGRTEPDPQARVAQANEDALVPPSRDGFFNAIQVWPYSDGALYQLYASPGRVSVIALQPGEGLVSVSSGDTARWIVSDTSSGRK
jgi:type IV secretion system protein TrbG